MNEETKKCPKCKEEVLKDAKKCKHCGADLRNWFIRHKIISVFLFLLFFINGLVVSDIKQKVKDNSINPAPVSIQKTEKEPEKAEEKPIITKEIIVTNQAVKQVDGKCRYFFLVENKDQLAFSGSVSIKVKTPTATVGTDTFTTTQPIEPTMGQVVYISTRTCPPIIHGEAGTNKFDYEVKENNQTVKTGSGDIVNSITE